MARGAQFSAMVLDLRAALRRSQSPAVGVEDLPTLKETLNHNYRYFWYNFDWPYLYQRFSLTINAGQRYYDPPTGLDIDRIEKVSVHWGNSYLPVKRGISFEEYNTHDSEQDERSSPILRWDLIYTSSGADMQIEVWPMPNSDTQSLYLEGIRAQDALVDDDDVCFLDDVPIVLLSAAELGQGAKHLDAKAKRDLALDMLRLARIRTVAGGSHGTTIGRGTDSADIKTGRTTVRIAASSS